MFRTGDWPRSESSFPVISFALKVLPWRLSLETKRSSPRKVFSFWDNKAKVGVMVINCEGLRFWAILLKKSAFISFEALAWVSALGLSFLSVWYSQLGKGSSDHLYHWCKFIVFVTDEVIKPGIPMTRLTMSLIAVFLLVIHDIKTVNKCLTTRGFRHPLEIGSMECPSATRTLLKRYGLKLVMTESRRNNPHSFRKLRFIIYLSKRFRFSVFLKCKFSSEVESYIP